MSERNLLEDRSDLGEDLVDVFGNPLDPPAAPCSQVESARLIAPTTPVVSVPDPTSETADPAVRANAPPVVIGNTIGT